MRLIHRASGGGVAVDLVLGVGLVGEWVAEAARRLPGWRLLGDALSPTNWSDPDALAQSLDQAAALLRSLSPAPAQVRLFWCAGRAGFGSSAAQCEGELRVFERTLSWAQRLGAEYPLEFHLASSAGGLHEGQLQVSSAAVITTHRPYAALKLAQEQALHAAGLPARFVYRLSSVYGVPKPGRRLGLVPTLVINALRQRATLITAYASTLRDFVATADVGRFMVLERKPRTSSTSEGIHYLVSGHPVSVWAVQVAVERHLLRRVPVVYSTRKGNVASTSFLPSMRPPRWGVSSVEANLPSIAGAAQSWVRAG